MECRCTWFEGVPQPQTDEKRNYPIIGEVVHYCDVGMVVKKRTGGGHYRIKWDAPNNSRIETKRQIYRPYVSIFEDTDKVHPRQLVLIYSSKEAPVKEEDW